MPVKTRSKAAFLLALILTLSLTCSYTSVSALPSRAQERTEIKAGDAPDTLSCIEETIPLERAGILLYLSVLRPAESRGEKQILLVHGLTYSSHVFDLDYEDYSLARRLVREGYTVYRLDIAGYGRSGAVEDGFLPDSDYAALDIEAAVLQILRISGAKKLDLLGWSWGTVTSSRFVCAHPELVNRYILYAPILSGLGKAAITEPFHKNTWEHAADDFQRREDGSFDETVTDPLVIDLFCSNCWRYDGDASPNGGRRDLCTDPSELLIDLSAIPIPAMIICGDSDPYLNYELVNNALSLLPEGSRLEIIPGGSHVVFIERELFLDFQDRLVDYLES